MYRVNIILNVLEGKTFVILWFLLFLRRTLLTLYKAIYEKWNTRFPKPKEPWKLKAKHGLRAQNVCFGLLHVLYYTLSTLNKYNPTEHKTQILVGKSLNQEKPCKLENGK